MIVLVGFMGAGKTTVGRALAARTGVDFVDADDAVEADAGAAVPEIFDREGEEGFRAREAEVVGRLLATDRAAVVALGGGAPALAPVAEALARPGITVVHLDVTLDEALRRAGDRAARPMLRRADPARLYERRRRIYDSVATVTVPVAGRAPEEVAGEIVSRARHPFPVDVPVPGAPYRVYVGEGVAGRAADLLPPRLRPEVALVVTHDALAEHLVPVRASLENAKVDVAVATLPDGEGAKSVAVAEHLWNKCADIALHRGDLVVGLGGGVVTDLAGFVASTFNRGVAILQVPTTLLAQVDAAIGGKTGINLPHGKNLVGTFHQPAAVICDVAMLTTLPDGELVAGLAEAVKYGFIAEPDMIDEIAAAAPRLRAKNPGALARVVRRSAWVKAGVVARDERETGRRAILNYGHTFAHALEATAGYGSWRHGEAVAVGMMAAAYLARELGRIDEDAVTLHRHVLESLGLPVRADLDLAALEEAWKRDKKYEGGVRFVLLAEVGRAEGGVAAPREAIEAALERLRK